MNSPKLRFRAEKGLEFPDLKTKQLSEIMIQREEKSCITNELPLLSFTIEQGVIDPSEKKTNKRDFLTKDMKNKKYLIVEYNDIIYNPSNIIYGAIDRNKYRRGVVSPIYAVFETSELPEYIGLLTNNRKFINKTLKYLEGSVIKLRTLKPEDFLSIEVKIPCREEQKKVAKFFSLLDNAIDQTQSEVDAWEKQKRGVMQLLFNRKARFKEDDGSEFPEWEKQRLDKCCKIFTDGDWIESKDQSDSGIRLIQTGNIGTTEFLNKPDNRKWISEATFRRLNCKEVFPGDILVSRLPAPAGRACIIPDLGVKMITAVDCTIIRTGTECNKEFLVQYLSTPQYFYDIGKALAGGTRQRISRSNLAEIIIPYPCLAEQQKIAACLSAFDDVIDKTKKELDAYRELKNGLLQQMFV